MIHIGSLIQDRVSTSGMKITEFARRIGKTSSNIYNIFERESIDTDLLDKISTVLEYDFFQHYCKPIQGADADRKAGAALPDRPTISITINNIDEKRIGRIFRKLNDIIS